MTLQQLTHVDGYYSRVTKKEDEEIHFLFNDTVNTFYLLLYDVSHLEKDHSGSERGTRCRYTWATLSDMHHPKNKDHLARGNPMPPHGLLVPINSKGSFICTIPQTGEHWMEREIAQWVHHEGPIR